MKKLLFFVISFLFFNVSASSAYSGKALSVALSAPDNRNVTKQQITKYLVSAFDNDYDKLKAIAYWIASHISYDDYKYDGKKANLKELNYKYDTFDNRTGICGDFASLFKEMADIAGIKKVEYISGYVIEADTIKRSYRLKDMPESGHAWNKVTLDGRSFFVDTTFMSNSTLRDGSIRRPTTLKHKLDVKKNKRHHEINKDIEDFFFDFTPKKEVRTYHKIHLSDKYVH